MMVSQTFWLLHLKSAWTLKIKFISHKCASFRLIIYIVCGGSPHGVMANMLDSDILVSELDL